MTQEQMVLKYMKEHNGITTLEAFRDLGITRLSARIYDLRTSGKKIISSRETGINRFGEVCYFTRYKICE